MTSDPTGSLEFEYSLAKELGKTHAQLFRELGPGELAYWRAFFECEHERYTQARNDAQRGPREDN